MDFTTGTTPYHLAIQDLDGDGKPDLAIANNGTDKLSVLQNTSSIGTISFAARESIFTAGTDVYCVAIGDMDGDDKIPIWLWSITEAEQYLFFRNTSSPGSISLSSFTLSGNLDGFGSAICGNL